MQPRLKWNNKTCQCECKNYCKCKKHYSWRPSICSCKNSQYLKSIADALIIMCDEIKSVMDIVWTKIKNIIATNVSVNCHSIKAKYKIDCYIFLHTVLLVTILLLIITIISYHYAKHSSKQKKHWCTNNMKWKMMNLTMFLLKTCYYFGDIIKLKDFVLIIIW